MLDNNVRCNFGGFNIMRALKNAVGGGELIKRDGWEIKDDYPW